MIIAKIMGGLGNQLFQYAIGRILSEKKETELKLDISFFENYSLRSYKLHHYNIKAEQVTTEELEGQLNRYKNNEIYNKAFGYIEKLTPKSKRRSFLQKNAWIYEPALFNTSANVYINGIWQHHKYFEDVPDAIFTELTLKSALPFDTQQILAQIEHAPNAVSIHIRRGDYISNPKANKLFGILPMHYYTQSIDYIKQKDNNLQFFVFSDDLDWAKKNFDFIAPVSFVDSGKDYTDLMLMSKCKYNIIANSSFSWWGAFLNRHPEKMVLCPKQWVTSNDLNSQFQIQLPSWIKM